MAFISMIIASIGLLVIICILLYLGFVLITTITLDSLWFVKKRQKKKVNGVLKFFAVVQSVQFCLFIVAPIVFVIMYLNYCSIVRATLPSRVSDIRGVDWSNAIIIDGQKYVQTYELHCNIQDPDSDPRFTKAALMGARYVYSIDNQTEYEIYAIMPDYLPHPYIYIPEGTEDEILEFYELEADKTTYLSTLSPSNTYADPEQDASGTVDFDYGVMSELHDYAEEYSINDNVTYDETEEWVQIDMRSEDGLWQTSIRLLRYAGDQIGIVEGSYEGVNRVESLEEGELRDYVNAFLDSEL